MPYLAQCLIAASQGDERLGEIVDNTRHILSVVADTATQVIAARTFARQTATMATSARTDIGPDTTVNDLLQILPEASALLSDHGLDTCCGGGLTLAESCGDAGLDVSTLLTELTQVEARGA